MMAGTGARVGLLLADKQPGEDTGGQGPDFGKASPVALLVILLLLVAVVLLVRSMSKHLKRAHANLDADEPEQDQASGESEHGQVADELAGEGAQSGEQGAGGQRAAGIERAGGKAGHPPRQDGETLPSSGEGSSEAENLR